MYITSQFCLEKNLTRDEEDLWIRAGHYAAVTQSCFPNTHCARRLVVQEIKAVKAIIYAPQYIRLISCDIAPYPTYLANSAELTEFTLDLSQ
jgi:hypothetical protein